MLPKNPKTIAKTIAQAIWKNIAIAQYFCCLKNYLNTTFFEKKYCNRVFAIFYCTITMVWMWCGQLWPDFTMVPPYTFTNMIWYRIVLRVFTKPQKLKLFCFLCVMCRIMYYFLPNFYVHILCLVITFLFLSFLGFVSF